MKTKIFALSLAFLATTAFAKEDTPKKVEEIQIKNSDKFNESLKKYKGCNLKELSSHLVSGNNVHKQSFAVKHVSDEVAEYDFYAVTEDKSMNADRIRGATCEFVMKNNCRVFWGNIFNMAFIADKPTAAFPLDSTPHYMISPEITCDKFDFKKMQSKGTGDTMKKEMKMPKKEMKLNLNM